jgi:hypothetical protein
MLHEWQVGGIPPFWNEHHRKRVKSVFRLLSMLCHLDPSISDVEFVVNFHDYNKVLREAGASDEWGDAEHAPPFQKWNSTFSGAEGVIPEEDERARGRFMEHVPEYRGQDWELYYR